LESVKGLCFNSLSCSSSISEVTMGPKQRHKDARWIARIPVFSPSFHLFQSQHVLCTGIQTADDRRPNRIGFFALSLFFLSLTVTYSDMSVFLFFFLLELAELISFPKSLTCFSSYYKRVTEFLGCFYSYFLFLLHGFEVEESVFCPF